MMPFIWPGGSLSEIRRGWSHSIRHNPRGVAPPKAEKWEASGKTPEGKPLSGLFKGHGDHQGCQVGLSSLPQGNVHPGGILWPDIDFQRNGPGDQSPECRDPWGAGGLDWQAGTKGHQLCCKSLPKGDTIFCTVSLSHPTSWGWRGLTPLRPYTGEAVTHTAPGVVRRGKTRAPWWITYEMCITA